MMMQLPKALLVGASIAALSACSGGGTAGGTAGSSGSGTTPTLQEALIAFSLAEDDFDRVGFGDMPADASNGYINGTAFAQIPTAGTATYTGPGRVGIFTRTVSGTTTVDDETLAMLGTARVSVNFEDQSFAGSIRDMFSATETGTIDTVSGQVTISGGSFPVAGRPTEMAATATGALTTQGETYDITVPLTGLIRGTNTSAPDNIAVTAISLAGEDGTIAGSDLRSSVTITGDKFTAGGTGAFVNR